jgi:hypothetical protein
LPLQGSRSSLSIPGACAPGYFMSPHPGLNELFVPFFPPFNLNA